MWWIIPLIEGLRGVSTIGQPGASAPAPVVFEPVAPVYSPKPVEMISDYGRELAYQLEHAEEIQAEQRRVQAEREALVLQTISNLGGEGTSGATPGGTVQQYYDSVAGKFGVRVASIVNGEWSFDYVG